MNKQNKRIIIHTGPGKTGSSAIQAWLTKHTKLLEAQGVYYPKHDLSKNKISSGNLREVLTQDEEGKWQVDAQKVDQLLTRFNESKFTTLLLSSEFFFHQIINFQKLIPEAEYIAYLRNPVELIESHYNQSVKRHSNSRPFAVPKEINKFLWQYLERVFRKVNNRKIHLRPFDESLMVGGHIVSDLLSVIGVSLDNELDNKRVNPSFSFQCMEFKRLLNTFTLGPLEQQLDKILQSCDIGERVYSLIPATRFQELNIESCERMSAFIEKFSQQHLSSLLENFKSKQQRQYIEQRASLTQLNEVADYINLNDDVLFDRLKQLLENNANLVVDNPAIFEVFSVTYQAIDMQALISELLLTHINQFTVLPGKRGCICYELSCFYLQQHDLENALMFAKGAYHFNSKNQSFIEQLNKVIISINKIELVNKSNNKIHSNKFRTISKFKNLLKR